MSSAAPTALLAVLEALDCGAVLFAGDAELGRNQRVAIPDPTIEELRRKLVTDEFSAVTLPDGRKRQGRLIPLPGPADLHLLLILPPWAGAAELNRLRMANKELEAIFNSSYDELFVTDGSGITLRASAACERHYNMRPEDLEGRDVRELEARGIFTPSATLRVLQGRKRVTLMQETVTGRKLMVTANPVFDEKGNLVRVISNSRDVTEMLLLKKQLDEAEKQMALYSRELESLRKEQLRVPGLVAESPAMRQVLDLARRVAAVDTTVLILGESGVGKDMLAKTIHRQSGRCSGPFIEINCGAIPETLLESELFGYERGAFTGARKEGKPGMFELAHQGTLLLNEAADLPLSMQVKLLHALEDRTITRLGGRHPHPVDARIIAATNRNITDMVRLGQFREDLYYRLNVVPITIPPLRERREDILPLIQFHLERASARYGREKSLNATTLQRLVVYNWPGNVRELENLMERLVATSEGPEVTVADLPPHLSRQWSVVTDSVIPLREALGDLEERLYRLAWKQSRSSYRVAEMLGVSQSTAHRRIRRYLKSELHE